MSRTATQWLGGDEGFAVMTPEEIGAHIEHLMKIDADLRESGEMVDAQGLSGPEQAKIIQSGSDGEPVITDGPFPESKEFLAGYWIVDVDSEKRAIEIATHASAVPGKGGKPMSMQIELRSIMSAPAEDN